MNTNEQQGQDQWVVVRVGRGTEAHLALGSIVRWRFGRPVWGVSGGTVRCGCSRWTKRGGYGSVMFLTDDVSKATCERCIEIAAR